MKYITTSKLKKFLQNNECNVLLEEKSKVFEYVKAFKTEEDCEAYIGMRRKHRSNQIFLLVNKNGRKYFKPESN